MVLLKSILSFIFMALLYAEPSVDYPDFMATGSDVRHMRIHSAKLVGLHKLEFQVFCDNFDRCIETMKGFRFFGSSPYLKTDILFKLSLRGYCAGTSLFDTKSDENTIDNVAEINRQTFSLELNPNIIVGNMHLTFEHIRVIEFRKTVLPDEEPEPYVETGRYLMDIPHRIYSQVHKLQHNEQPMACYDEPPMAFIADFSVCGNDFSGKLFAVDNITLFMKDFDVVRDKQHYYRENLYFATYKPTAKYANDFIMDSTGQTTSFNAGRFTKKVKLSGALELMDIESVNLMCESRSICKIPIPEEVRRNVSTRFYYRDQVVYKEEKMQQRFYCETLQYVVGSKPAMSNGYLVDSKADYVCYNGFYLYPVGFSFMCKQEELAPKWKLMSGFIGAECISPELTCRDKPCQHNGKCNSNNVCDCPNYAQGKFCESVINKCNSNPCNNQECHPIYEEQTYECVCPYNHRRFLDENCFPITDVLKKCGSGGIRYTHVGRAIQCECIYGYVALPGEKCEKAPTCKHVAFMNGKLKSDKMSFSSDEHVEIECNQGYKPELEYVFCSKGVFVPSLEDICIRDFTIHVLENNAESDTTTIEEHNEILDKILTDPETYNNMGIKRTFKIASIVVFVALILICVIAFRRRRRRS